MNEETQVEDKTLDRQLAELEMQKHKLTAQINQAKSAAAQKQLLSISDSARKRQEAEAEEELALAEIRKRRQDRIAEQQAEAKVEADRIAVEQNKRLEELNIKLSKEKAQRLADELQKNKVREEHVRAYEQERELNRKLLDLDEHSSSYADATPATLNSMPSPLSRIFFPTGGEGAEQIQAGVGFSSVQNAQRQAKIDRIDGIKEFGPITAFIQTAQPEPEPAPAFSPRKSKHFIDTSNSREIEALIRKELKMTPNPDRCDLLSANWEYVPLLAAVREVIEQAKVRPMGHDSFFGIVDSLLENMDRQTTPAPTRSAEEIAQAYAEQIAKFSPTVGVTGGN